MFTLIALIWRIKRWQFTIHESRWFYVMWKPGWTLLNTRMIFFLLFTTNSLLVYSLKIFQHSLQVFLQLALTVLLLPHRCLQILHLHLEVLSLHIPENKERWHYDKMAILQAKIKTVIRKYVRKALKYAEANRLSLFFFIQTIEIHILKRFQNF